MWVIQWAFLPRGEVKDYDYYCQCVCNECHNTNHIIIPSHGITQHNTTRRRETSCVVVETRRFLTHTHRDSDHPNTFTQKTKEERMRIDKEKHHARPSVSRKRAIWVLCGVGIFLGVIKLFFSEFMLSQSERYVSNKNSLLREA
jgi:hypothetical protein